MKNSTKESFANISWWWIVLSSLFMMPVGMVLLILKVIGLSGKKQKALKRSRSGLKKAGIGLFAFGGLISLSSLSVGWIWLLAGALMTLCGILKDKNETLYERYLAVIGRAPVLPISSIAATMQVSEDKCEADLQKMIDKGYFEDDKPFIDKYSHEFVLDAAYVGSDYFRKAHEVREQTMRSREENEYNRYMAVIGDKKYMPIAEIAAILSKPYEKCETELQRMIENRDFGENKPYIDKKLRMFILDARYSPTMESARAQAAAQKAEDKAAPGSGLSPEYEDILTKIHKLNDAIADKKVSDAIDHIEMITRSMFENVSAHPEKKDQITSFMNYYLPTTLKLLGSYAELERQPTAAENIVKSKERIEHLLDQLAWAFEQQLNRIFESDALDIDSDIKVMEQMLARDGLSNNGSTLVMPKVPSSSSAAAAQKKAN